MSTQRVDSFAVQHGLSNNQAKRALGLRAVGKSGKRRGQSEFTVGGEASKRGGPVAGTGKPTKA